MRFHASALQNEYKLGASEHLSKCRDFRCNAACKLKNYL